MTEPSATVVDAWARLLRAHQAALAVVEIALKAAGLPPLAWYDVLLEVERVGEKGLRPFELQHELLLPQYGLSRLLDRIEKAGYLERRSCAEDGRGQRVFITQAGKEARRRMWPVYARAIQQAVGDKLTATEAETLSTLLKRLL